MQRDVTRAGRLALKMALAVAALEQTTERGVVSREKRGGATDRKVSFPKQHRVDDRRPAFVDYEIVPVHLRHGLNRTANLFLDHYLEEYDFLYFVTDHPIPTSRTVAMFEPVNRPAEPGGGNEIEIWARGYKTQGRLKGVVGVQWRPPSYPPLAHETLHFWANFLDESFGFGAARESHYGVHWGFSSVDGVLGGFTLESLRCVTPANALPPARTPLGNGRTRYLAAPFWPNDDSYAGASPLELYLMGVLDKTDCAHASSVSHDCSLLRSSAASPSARASPLNSLGKRELFDRAVLDVDHEHHRRAVDAVFCVLDGDNCAHVRHA